MSKNVSQNKLPDNKESLEVIKLQEEIHEIRENIEKARFERSWNFPNMIKISLAILVGISPVIFAGLNYNHEVKKFVATLEREQKTLEREQKFKVGEEVIKLFRDLDSEDPDKERIAALAMITYESAALPFLIEHLNIPHNIKTYSAINRSLRLIVNGAEVEEEGERMIFFIWHELMPILEENLTDFMNGELFETEILEAQIRALGLIAVGTKYSSRYSDDIIRRFRQLRDKIRKKIDVKKNPGAEILLSLMDSFIKKK